MISNWEKSFSFLLKSEGGYSNDADDRGGATNLGVTKKAWEEYVGHPVDEDEIKSLTPEMVKSFYKGSYWDKCSCDALPEGLDYSVFDFAVNAGSGVSAKCFQRAVGVPDDSVIGPQTLSVLGKFRPESILEKMLDERRKHYYNIINKNPTQVKFLKGWMNRVDAVRQNALEMINGAKKAS